MVTIFVLSKDDLMQISPSRELSKLIKHYLFLESNSRNIKQFRLFPDGNTGIVFSLKNKLISELSPLQSIDYLPNSFIYGQIDHYKNIFCEGEISLLIIVLHPNGLNLLLGKPANELINQIIDICDLFGVVGKDVTDQLFECKSIENRIKIVESFITKIYKYNLDDTQQLVSYCMEHIVTRQGLSSVKQLEDITGYTRKSLERKFKETIGIHPKKFSNIIQLNFYLKNLRDKPTNKFSEQAYGAGYFDHAYAAKQCKKITGLTPIQYTTEFSALALNLLEFPKIKSSYSI